MNKSQMLEIFVSNFSNFRSVSRSGTTLGRCRTSTTARSLSLYSPAPQPDGGNLDRPAQIANRHIKVPQSSPQYYRATNHLSYPMATNICSVLSSAAKPPKKLSFLRFINLRCLFTEISTLINFN